MDISFDILNQIFELLDFLSKIRFRQISKYFLHNLYIYDFYNLDNIFIQQLSEEILISNPKIKYLDITGRDTIQNINFLTDLQDLAVSHRFKTKFNNYNIKKLKIINYKISNLKYFTKLENLYLIGSDIANSDLDNLNLRKLVLNNNQVSNINHLTRLKKLSIRYNSEIKNLNIQNLDLLKLEIESSFGITELNFLTNLRYLKLYNPGTYNLSKINLQELRIQNNNSDFSHMTNLTKLLIASGPEINLSRINLSELFIRDNKSDFSHMINLTNLDIAGRPYPVNLNKLINLKILNCNYSAIRDQDILNINPEIILMSHTEITDISHMTNLRELHAYNSKMTKIINPNLEKLDIHGNSNINKISLKKLKQLSVNNPNLVELDCPNLEQLFVLNNNIANFNNLKNLKNLSIRDGSNIYNTSIQNLELDCIEIVDNQTITDLNYMTSLKILSITGDSGLQNTSIQKLNLLELKIHSNKTITNINNFINLRKLILGPDNGLDYEGVKNLDQNKIKKFCRVIPDIFKKPDI